MALTTWLKEIVEEMEKHGENWLDVVKKTDFDENEEFYGGFGISHGEPFTVWTEKRVYFPVVYDGAEWCGSVPRNPCDEATEHFGGQ